MPRTRTEFLIAANKKKNREKQKRWRDKLKANPEAHDAFKKTEKTRVALHRFKKRREMSEDDKQANKEKERIRKAAYRKKKREEGINATRNI